jgi:hypothetical protein
MNELEVAKVKAAAAYNAAADYFDHPVTSPEIQSKQVLMDMSVLHDDQKVFAGVLDQLDIRNRIHLNQQKICERHVTCSLHCRYIDEADVSCEHSQLRHCREYYVGVRVDQARHQRAPAPLYPCHNDFGRH